MTTASKAPGLAIASTPYAKPQSLKASKPSSITTQNKGCQGVAVQLSSTRQFLVGLFAIVIDGLR